MYITPEATAALNDYLDGVNHALPLAPSQRISVVDRLYRQIIDECESKAREQNRLEIDLDLVQTSLARLGSPEEQAKRLGQDEQRASEVFNFDQWRFGERATGFARAAAERGGDVFRMSIETAANALDLAAQKLREAAEKLNAKT